MKKSIFDIIKNTRIQLSIILAIVFYIVALLYVEYKSPIYAEKIYPILKEKEITKKLASNVEIGFFINNFPKFSINKNKFMFDAIVWFKFPVGSESINTIEKFNFKNGEIIYKSKPMIKLIKDDVVVAYQVKVDFRAYLNYKNFPLGDHRLNIILENRSVSQNELCFNCELENFRLADNILVSTWQPIQKVVQSGYLVSHLKKSKPQMDLGYPCAVFTIDFENNSLRDLITLYFPMYVIFLICLFTMMIGLKHYLTRISIIAASMPILVLFRTVILQLSPDLSEITKADFTYFLLVLLSFLILLLQAYITLAMKKIIKYNEAEQTEKLNNLEKLNNIVLLSTLIFLVVAITYCSFFF